MLLLFWTHWKYSNWMIVLTDNYVYWVTECIVVDKKFKASLSQSVFFSLSYWVMQGVFIYVIILFNTPTLENSNNCFESKLVSWFSRQLDMQSLVNDVFLLQMFVIICQRFLFDVCFILYWILAIFLPFCETVITIINWRLNHTKRERENSRIENSTKLIFSHQ